jgi:hypothetical protein
VSICQDAGIRLSSIENVSLADHDDGQRLVFHGSTIGGDVYICTASINPTKPNGATMTSLTKQTTQNNAIVSTGKTIPPSAVQPIKDNAPVKTIEPSAKLINPASIKQFLITTTKPLIYTMR